MLWFLDLASRERHVSTTIAMTPRRRGRRRAESTFVRVRRLIPRFRVRRDNAALTTRRSRSSRRRRIIHCFLAKSVNRDRPSRHVDARGAHVIVDAKSSRIAIGRRSDPRPCSTVPDWSSMKHQPDPRRRRDEVREGGRTQGRDERGGARRRGEESFPASEPDLGCRPKKT